MGSATCPSMIGEEEEEKTSTEEKRERKKGDIVL